MNQSKSPHDFHDRVIPILFFIILSATFTFFTVRWWVQWHFFAFRYSEIYAVLWYFNCFLGFFFVSFRLKNLKFPTLIWAIVHLEIILILGILELILPLRPNWVPDSLASRNPSLLHDGGPRKADMIEYLRDAPWIKFKANAWIRSQGLRGSDFTYDWVTDELGFKNRPGLSRQSPLTAVAIGDSFVEGMGLPVDKTWTALLTKAGYPTYNLGVQGYSPSQISGALKLFGIPLKPRLVLLGYTPGIEDRERLLSDSARQNKDGFFSGGIESIRVAARDSEMYVREIRHVHPYFKVTNAVLDLIEDQWERWRAGTAPRGQPSLEPAIIEIERTKGLRFHAEAPKSQKAWAAILEMKKQAQNNKIPLVVIIFTLRSAAYYELITGKVLPQNHYEVRFREFLKPFLTAHGIEFIDLLPPLQGYVRKWKGNPIGKELPFFSLDGHMNETGQWIITEEIKRYLDRRQANARAGATTNGR